MNKRPLVHIGYHKTATTWLQQVLFPRIGNAEMVPRSLVIDALVEVGALDYQPEAARRQLETAAPGRMIVSFESLSGYLHNGGMSGTFSKEMANRLRETLPDADIVIFIRRQTDILAASYAQYIPYGGTYSADRYLLPREHKSPKHVRRDKHTRFELEHFAYLPLLRLYRRLFGDDNVHVFLYEDFKADRAAFVEKFCDRFGLECGSFPESPEPHDASLPGWVLPVVRGINLFTAGRVHDKNHLFHIPGAFWLGRGAGRVLSRLAANGGSDLSRLASADRIREIEDHYAPTNRILAAEFDLPRSRYGYPLRQPGPVTEAAPHLAARPSAARRAIP